ncbi:MAG: hypothetical protein OHK0040_05040 [bacterium]
MFAKFIKQLRKKNNFTQSFIAKELGISRQTYMQIEEGKRDITITEANKLASIFGLNFEDFISQSEPKQEIVLENGIKTREKKGEIKIRITQKNLKKFKQVLLYILEKVGAKPNVGETVIHKLLYFIDFDYYEKYEENLMGLTYIKNHHGPTSVELGEILKNMQKNSEVIVIKNKYFNHLQKKYLPVIKPDLSLLSAKEIQHIDEVLNRLSDKNAKEIESYSHGDVPWKTAKKGKPISYESVFYRDEVYSVRNYEDEL